MKKYVLFVYFISILIYGYTELKEVTPVAVDTYILNLSLKVPQVLSNTNSKGYRKYKNQLIKGNMYIIWMSDGNFKIEFSGLENQNFKVGGKKVTYIGTEVINVVSSRFNWIGSNKTDVFKTPCLSFYLELEPSYAQGGNTEDNSFYLMMAGMGVSSYRANYKSRIAYSLSGYASGTQGCGCSEYEHKSPTRTAKIYGPSDSPEDVVATFGKWSAKWKGRELL